MATRGRPKHPDILTPREWEVLALIRESLTNDQIGQRLGIGAEGVKSHVSEILGKLGLSSREEAAAWDPRQRPDWTPRWDTTRRPAWATALAPFGFFWRRLTGGLAHSAGSLATVTSVGLGVALVAGVTIFAVLVLRTIASSNDASATPPAVVGQSAVTGKIAFLSRRDGNQEIYVMNADGSGQTNLSNGLGDDSFDTWSPDGSRIAFTSDRDGNWEIYVVNADGSGLTNLTKDPGDDGVVRQNTGNMWASALAWSPDGSRIAFVSNRDGNNEVYVVAADGSGETRLTNNPCDDGATETGPERGPGALAWSPGGSRLAFFSHDHINFTPGPDYLTHAAGNCGSTIYVVNADGSNVTRLANFTNISAADCPPDNVCPIADVGELAWSPDGSRIAFNLIHTDVSYKIYVVNADGSGLTSLSDPAKEQPVEVSPAWSPDSSRLAFISSRDGSYEIYAMNADGSGQTRLTNGDLANVGPGAYAWSPDGSRIEFVSNREGNSEIYVVNADGSGQTNVTNNPSNELVPAWSPDGSRIAFLTGRDGNGEIYVMNADGSGPTNLTNNPGEDYDPAWSPAR